MRDLRAIREPWIDGQFCSVVAAAVGAVGALGGAAISSSAAKKAAKTQVGAANAANDLTRGMFDDIRGDLSPYNQFGQGALTGLNRFLSGDPAQVQRQLESTPGYQFALSQGLKSVQNGAAARGLGVSGAAMKGAANYATGLADNTFGAQFARYLDAARLGESAAAQTGSFGTQAASTMSNNLIGAGNAAAGGQVGSANAIAGGLGNLANIFTANRIFGGAGGGGMYGTPGAPLPQVPYSPSMDPIF